MIEHHTSIDSTVGQTHTGSGHIIVYNIGLAYQALKEALPENAPALHGLVESLKGFAIYHELINEWKDLHNLLQELHLAADQFLSEVDERYKRSVLGDVKELQKQWRPCGRNIRVLVKFAVRIKYISIPYRDENGILYGPSWAVEIVGKQRDLEQMLKEANCDIGDLYDLASEFSHDCITHLYEADKNLRDEVNKLYVLSNLVLAKLTE